MAVCSQQQTSHQTKKEHHSLQHHERPHHELHHVNVDQPNLQTTRISKHLEPYCPLDVPICHVCACLHFANACILCSCVQQVPVVQLLCSQREPYRLA